MKGPFLSAAAAVVILAVSPVEAAHAPVRVPDSNAQATAGLDHQSFQMAQTGKASETTEAKQGKTAEPKAVKAKALRRAYAIRARIAKQKRQLAKSKKQVLKEKRKQKA